MLVPAIGNAHDRRERDNAARPAATHAGSRRPCQPEDALQVDVEGQIPLVVRQLAKRRAMGNPGIGNDDVDTAVARFDVGYQCIGRCSRAYVIIGKLGRAAGGADRLDGRCTLALQNIGHHDMITGRCERLGRRLADADAGTGDNDNAGSLRRICHRIFPVRALRRRSSVQASGRRRGLPPATPGTTPWRPPLPARRSGRAAIAVSWRRASRPKVP
ncbi:hypothetical protein D9M72_463890 [compost metagenome]